MDLSFSRGFYTFCVIWQDKVCVTSQRSKMFFFEKKNQKTFAPLRVRVAPFAAYQKNQSFFASFCSQKEVLASFAVGA
jgi:hypothetical protein